MRTLVIAVVMGIGCSVQGALVAGWDVAGVDLDGGLGVETNASPFNCYATTSGTGRVTARLSLGAGVNPSTSSGQYGFKISLDARTNSLAGAIALNHYMEISIAVEPGYALNLSALEVVGQSTGTGCTNVVLMTSMDGYTAGNEIAQTTTANTTGGFDTDASGFGGPIGLIAPQYQNLTGTVSFRFYGWNNASGIGVTYVRNLTGLDLAVFGEVVKLPGDASPMLSLVATNGISCVSATFTGPSTASYVLQYRQNLGAFYEWSTVSAPFTSNATWEVETTHSTGFYRAITN